MEAKYIYICNGQLLLDRKQYISATANYMYAHYTINIMARGYNKIFVLNSAEHEILNAHKYENIKKFRGFFSGSYEPRMLFFPAHNC